MLYQAYVTPHMGIPPVVLESENFKTVYKASMQEAKDWMYEENIDNMYVAIYSGSELLYDIVFSAGDYRVTRYKMFHTLYVLRKEVA